MAGRPAGDGYQLLVAVVGSVTVTCVTILLALLALFFIRKTLLNRRRTFTYQSGSVRAHLRFSRSSRVLRSTNDAFLEKWTLETFQYVFIHSCALRLCLYPQGEETILQFNSGTLTLTRRPKPTPEPLTYPILEWEDIKFEDVIGEGNFGQVSLI